MRASNKDYTLRIYRPGAAGALIEVINDFTFTGFRKQVNAGLGQLTVQIPRRFDDFGEGDLISVNNRLEITVVDRDNSPSGEVIYSGWISSYESAISDEKETVTVYAMGYLTKMAKSMGRITFGGGLQVSGLTTTGTGIGTIAMPVDTATEEVFKSIVDKWRLLAVNPIINYATGSVDATGAVMNASWDEKYFLEMLKDCLGATPAGAGWYFYAGADNVLKFKAKPSTPTHTLVQGKDFSEIKVNANADSVVNNVLFESSNEFVKMLRHATDSGSESLVDDRWDVVKDNTIAKTSTGDSIANQKLAANKNLKRKISVTVIDNNLQDETQAEQTGYDIERLNPGDTVAFAGFSPITALNFGSNNLQIVTVDYRPDGATLELEEVQENLSRSAYQAGRDAQLAYPASDFTLVNSSSIPDDVGDIKTSIRGSNHGRWLLLNGQAVSRADCANLFSLFAAVFGSGTFFGVGNGTTTFNLPNLQDRFILMASGTKGNGSFAGSDTANLNHRHAIFYTGSNPADLYTPDGRQWMAGGISQSGSGTDNSRRDVSVPLGSTIYYSDYQGSTTQSLLTPYFASNFFMKY